MEIIADMFIGVAGEEGERDKPKLYDNIFPDDFILILYLII